MQARRQNDVRMKTVATLARAKASAQSASKVRQMVAENQRAEMRKVEAKKVPGLSRIGPLVAEIVSSDHG